MRTPAILLMLVALCSCDAGRDDAQPAPTPTTPAAGPTPAASGSTQPGSAAAAPAQPAAPAAARHETSAAAPPALRNDAVYAEFLAKVAKAEPEAGDPRRVAWLERVAAAAAEARDYERAAGYLRQLLAAGPGLAQHHAGLSANLGRLGRYDEALAEADRAASLPEGDTLRIRALRAGWRCALGRRDQGRALFAAVPQPSETSEDWPAYLSARTFLAACDHDGELVHAGITALAALGGQELETLQRDAIYDAYRTTAWFIAAVGETQAR